MGEKWKQPVRPKDKIEVTIESIGEKGDGIAKKEGFAIIIPDTKMGETYNVTITKVFEKYAFATIDR